MEHDNNERAKLRALTHDQLKAAMPTNAAKFFTQHPPLLEAFRYGKLGDKLRETELTKTYFSTLPPYLQYQIVLDIADAVREITFFELTQKTIAQIKQASRREEMLRLSYYGLNLHLNSESITAVLDALSVHDSSLLAMLNQLEQILGENPNDSEASFEYTLRLDQRKAVHVAKKEILTAIGRIYPTLGAKA